MTHAPHPDRLPASWIESITDAQRRANMTRADIARATGLPECTVKRILDGTHAPSIGKARRIAAAVGLILIITRQDIAELIAATPTAAAP